MTDRLAVRVPVQTCPPPFRRCHYGRGAAPSASWPAAVSGEGRPARPRQVAGDFGFLSSVPVTDCLMAVPRSAVTPNATNEPAEPARPDDTKALVLGTGRQVDRRF